MGVKTRSFTTRANRPISKCLEVFDSPLPPHSKTTSTSVVESIEYASNSNSSYISLVESINDENEDETTVNPNYTATKVDSPVAKSKTYEENVGSTKTKIPYQTRNNNTKFKNNIKIITKPGTPIVTSDNVEKLLKNKRILITSPLAIADTLSLLKADLSIAELVHSSTKLFIEHGKAQEFKW